ncbi:hypothetical protein [Paenibacillus cymbidii]|uniref:hypothetical protein n=1 Tax=Paenibacillus cymbidii TaxID=1639034 RepID=UPI001F27A6C7|nr:hypothetical protein [Paenibacillus cymbidii]
MITHIIAGYDADRAARDLERKLSTEIAGLTGLVMETAKSNVKYYAEVRRHLQRHMNVLVGQMIEGEVTANYWQAWLEQFGKGSLMAGSDQNPGLVSYMNSEAWNRLRSTGKRVIVGRGRGQYKSIDGTVRYSGGSFRGVDLEELAARGDIDKKFGPTPPTFFLRKALESNRNRILAGLARVIDDFPYHKYFRSG